MSTESDAIRRIAQEYISGINSGDLTKWLGTLTDDIVFLPPDQPLVSGKNAVCAWAKETFFDPFRMKLNVSFDEIEVLGDTAHAYGRFTLFVSQTACGDTSEQRSTPTSRLGRQRRKRMVHDKRVLLVLLLITFFIAVSS